MGPKPGQIRCPTCHRSTLPAAYCTHCGSPIPESARAQPRGLNRDELQERIRARRSGPMPFRRGSSGDEGYEAPPFAERYEPEPEDDRIRRRRAAAASGAAGVAGADALRRVDNTAPGFDAEAEAARLRAEEEAAAQREADRRWARPAEEEAGPFRRGQEAAAPVEGGVAPAAPTPHEEPPPWPDEARAAGGVTPPPAPPPGAPMPAPVPPPYEEPEPEVIDRFDDDAYETPDPRYYYETEERSGAGIGVGAVLGIAALGVLALFVGIMLAGVFGGDDGVGQEVTSPSASAAATEEASTPPSASALPSATATAAPSASASGSVTFPDGFEAEAQPCANPPNSADCGSSGARNNGNVWIVVSFRNGTASDVVSATVERSDGTQVPGGGSIALADINCGDSCNGYTYFQFQNLEDGTYTVHVTRNGEPAGETGFTVER